MQRLGVVPDPALRVVLRDKHWWFTRAVSYTHLLHSHGGRVLPSVPVDNGHTQWFCGKRACVGGIRLSAHQKSLKVINVLRGDISALWTVGGTALCFPVRGAQVLFECRTGGSGPRTDLCTLGCKLCWQRVCHASNVKH